MSDDKTPTHLSVKECVAHSGKSASTIRKWIKDGRLKTRAKRHKNSKVMVERNSLMALLQISVEVTPERSGISQDNRLQNVDHLEERIKELEENIRLLELVSNADKQMIINQQPLKTR